MISPIPSSVALRISPVTRIMPAKVIMLMHANGERDGEEPEKWRSSYTRGRKDKSIRGRFEYIYIFSYSSFTLFPSPFFSVHSFSFSITSRVHLIRDEVFNRGVTVHSNKLFFTIFSRSDGSIEAVDKEKKILSSALCFSLSSAILILLPTTLL